MRVIKTWRDIDDLAKIHNVLVADVNDGPVTTLTFRVKWWQWLRRYRITEFKFDLETNKALGLKFKYKVK